MCVLDSSWTYARVCIRLLLQCVTLALAVCRWIKLQKYLVPYGLTVSSIYYFQTCFCCLDFKLLTEMPTTRPTVLAIPSRRTEFFMCFGCPYARTRRALMCRPHRPCHQSSAGRGESNPGPARPRSQRLTLEPSRRPQVLYLSTGSQGKR